MYFSSLYSVASQMGPVSLGADLESFEPSVIDFLHFLRFCRILYIHSRLEKIQIIVSPSSLRPLFSSLWITKCSLMTRIAIFL